LEKREEEGVMSLYRNGFRDSIPDGYTVQKSSSLSIDVTMMQIRSDQAWLWVAVVEPVHRQILGVYVHLKT
jgi:hypothetical protein